MPAHLFGIRVVLFHWLAILSMLLARRRAFFAIVTACSRCAREKIDAKLQNQQQRVAAEARTALCGGGSLEFFALVLGDVGACTGRQKNVINGNIKDNTISILQECGCVQCASQRCERQKCARRARGEGYRLRGR